MGKKETKQDRPSKEDISYQEQQKEESVGKLIHDSGQFMLKNNGQHHRIHLLNIIGEIEGHECLPSNAKTTKYEHVLPKLAAIEDDSSVDGVLLILNTM